MKLMPKLFTFVLFVGVVLLCACTNQYALHTNVDKNNFAQYFAPANVAIYNNEQAFNASYQALGGVEGDACQAKAHHELPSEIEARTAARRAADKLGANAIIFTGCTLIDNNDADKHCIRTRICYGRAFYLDVKKQTK